MVNLKMGKNVMKIGDVNEVSSKQKKNLLLDKKKQEAVESASLGMITTER